VRGTSKRNQADCVGRRAFHGSADHISDITGAKSARTHEGSARTHETRVTTGILGVMPSPARRTMRPAILSGPEGRVRLIVATPQAV